MSDQPACFDDQASDYDERVGLSDEVCSAVAAAAIDLAGVAAGDAVLDCGAGTGAIGVRLAIEGVRYTAFDRSEEMLAQYRARLPADWPGSLVQADGDETWPAEDGSVKLVFGSRSLHLLDTEHVVSEVRRVAAPEGATLLIGRIQRAEDSVKARMRVQMRTLLEAHGVEPRRGDARRKRLVRDLVDAGGERIRRVEVARWAVAHAPLDSLRSWRDKDGIAGVDPPGEVKTAVLDELEAWALSTFGGLADPLPSDEVYTLSGVRL